MNNNKKGFTLIELIVTMAILAILVSLAAPSFQSVINSNKLTSTANEILAGVQTARMEAIRRNSRVGLCFTDNPDVAAPACTAVPANWIGYIIFVDNGNCAQMTSANGVGGCVTASRSNGLLNANETIVRTSSFTNQVQVLVSNQINTATPAVIFRPDGYSKAADSTLIDGTIRVCIATTAPPQNIRDVALNNGSQMRVMPAANGGGACVAP